jgi:hypothetical protein
MGAPMAGFTYAEFPIFLRNAVPGFDRVFDDHLRRHGELVPHLLMADLVRFLAGEVRIHGSRSRALRPAMALLERGMGSEDPRLQQLLAVSFVENLDPRSDDFAILRRTFGRHLEQRYAAHERRAHEAREQPDVTARTFARPRTPRSAGGSRPASRGTSRTP